MAHTTSTPTSASSALSRLRQLPRNVWAVSLTSFFMDVSSEMVVYVLPLYLANVLGVRTGVIGLIEGVAESTASLLKLFSGWLSDRLMARKWLAVAGYALSAITKPFFLVANSWGIVAGVRWIDRVGKGIRTAPRDALVADSVPAPQRGFAFGFQRAADTAGASLGLLFAWLVVTRLSGSPSAGLDSLTFRRLILFSLIPAGLAVLALVFLARDVPVTSHHPRPRFALRSLGRPFLAFMVFVTLFDLGNSSDAFLVLRAQERGLGVGEILLMIFAFNLVYTLVSAPAGSLSDRIGRRRLIVGGWLIYALIYLGFALARTGVHIWLLYVVYGLYYGLTLGSTKAIIADLVPEALYGTAYGAYNAVLGLIDFPASLIAGLLWQGAGGWGGFGPQAPFFFGAALALLAAVLMAVVMPRFLPPPTEQTP